MAGVEAHLLKCILLCGAMRPTLSCAKVNSISKGMVSQAQLIGWNQKHMGVNFENTTAAILGKKYWENLWNRNAIEIERKKAVKFNSKREVMM
jgi:hypothetical protein